MWFPDLTDGTGPLYDRLADALERDLATGVLQAGYKLPPQRDLAHALKISVGTVTKAYAQAERRGLLEAHVGRGSYVRGPAPAVTSLSNFSSTQPTPLVQGAMIDLRSNIPPLLDLSRALSDAVASLGARQELEFAVRYNPGNGLLAIREAAAAWLGRQHDLDARPDDIIQCNGGQQGIALAFSALCRPGDTILCESSTFYGAKIAAEHLALTLRGVAMDDGGLQPAALERAIVETRSRVLFAEPTLHNPTTRTWSRTRRDEIISIARRHDLTIIEDDAYYAYGDRGARPPTIAALAPERTIYIASISKSICPGLRVAFLVLPRDMARLGLMRGVRALGYSPPALGALIFSRWVEDMSADAMTSAVMTEIDARMTIAQKILGELVVRPGGPRSPHLWLPMSPLSAERTCARAMAAGVAITPPDASTVSRDADSGIRVCLGAPQDRGTLERAISIVSAAISGNTPSGNDGII